jgi:hypothetical protein
MSDDALIPQPWGIHTAATTGYGRHVDSQVCGQGVVGVASDGGTLFGERGSSATAHLEKGAARCCVKGISGC